jgi:hypothetical protein
MGLNIVLSWIGLAAISYAQDPLELLGQIREKIGDTIKRLPNYMCTQTVDRKALRLAGIDTWKGSPSCLTLIGAAGDEKKMELFTADRLRLDVAIGDRSEMYSWVGEGQFGDQELSQLVKEGATATGAFGSFLDSIFVANNAEFAFKGESQVSGRPVLQYTFRVPLAKSGYVVGNRGSNWLTGYSGVFSVDSKTLDLLTLEIQTPLLPVKSDMCQATTTLNYFAMRMNDADFLLPSQVDTVIVNTNGTESHNHTVFKGCHQFLGESKLIFDDKGPTEATGDGKAKVVNFRNGLKLSTALVQNINLATAAAGDPIVGKLVRTVKDAETGLLIPKGAKLNGRIYQLRTSYGPVTSLEFGMKWESIEWDGVSHPLSLELKTVDSSSANLPVDFVGGRRTMRERLPEILSNVRPDEPGVGFFTLPNIRKGYSIPSGFESNWVTVAVAPAATGK